MPNPTSSDWAIRLISPSTAWRPNACLRVGAPSAVLFEGGARPFPLSTMPSGPTIGAPTVGFCRIAKALRIEVCGNVTDLRLTGRTIGMPRLQRAVVARTGLDDNRRNVDRGAVRSGDSVGIEPGDGLANQPLGGSFAARSAKSFRFTSCSRSSIESCSEGLGNRTRSFKDFGSRPCVVDVREVIGRG
jgi:hypothetical protein